jgi:hypothetical protein
MQGVLERRVVPFLIRGKEPMQLSPTMKPHSTVELCHHFEHRRVLPLGKIRILVCSAGNHKMEIISTTSFGVSIV